MEERKKKPKVGLSPRVNEIVGIAKNFPGGPFTLERRGLFRCAGGSIVHPTISLSPSRAESSLGRQNFRGMGARGRHWGVLGCE